jgi:hypothetical protein
MIVSERIYILLTVFILMGLLCQHVMTHPPTVIINVPMGVYRSACRKSGGCGTGFYATQPYRRTNLPEPFKGKNVFIFFWTQGCVFWGKGLVVFSINIAEPKGDVREFVKQKGLIFPVLLDRDAKVTRKKYGVYMVPTLFLVGKDGVIKEKAYGHLSKEALWQFVNPYL